MRRRRRTHPWRGAVVKMTVDGLASTTSSALPGVFFGSLPLMPSTRTTQRSSGSTRCTVHVRPSASPGLRIWKRAPSAHAYASHGVTRMMMVSLPPDSFLKLLDEKLGAIFQSSMKNLYKEGSIHPFGDFMRATPEGKTAAYEEMPDAKGLKRFMEEKLEDYNMEPGVQGMDVRRHCRR